MKLCKTFTICVLALLCAPSWAAEKTDVVILNNGDKLTGEIKRLEAGLLEFSTDTMGTTYIEWRFIEEIISSKFQTVETTSGDRWLGRMQKPEQGEGIELRSERSTLQLDPAEVVAAWPVEATVWDKMDLDVSAGFDYAKSTDIANLNLAADFSYQTESRLTQASSRLYITRQGEGEEQTRNSLSASYQYFLPGRKYRFVLGGMETNEALGVDLRLYAGLGIGKYFRKTNSVWFSGATGLLATQEDPSEADSETNLEVAANVRYKFFRFASPERSLDTQFTLYPSVTDFGRVRADFRTTFKFELIKDLFWSLEAYLDYDSDPLSVDAEKSDYGVTSSLGWSY